MLKLSSKNASEEQLSIGERWPKQTGQYNFIELCEKGDAHQIFMSWWVEREAEQLFRQVEIKPQLRLVESIHASRAYNTWQWTQRTDLTRVFLACVCHSWWVPTVAKSMLWNGSSRAGRGCIYAWNGNVRAYRLDQSFRNSNVLIQRCEIAFIQHGALLWTSQH